MIPYWGCWGWNCGLGRLPKWPRSRRKKIDQKSWNRQFLSYKNVLHLKRKLRTIIIQIWNKIRWFCYQKVEKNINYLKVLATDESQMGNLEWDVFFKTSCYMTRHGVTQLKIFTANMAGQTQLKKKSKLKNQIHLFLGAYTIYLCQNFQKSKNLSFLWVVSSTF